MGPQTSVHMFWCRVEDRSVICRVSEYNAGPCSSVRLWQLRSMIFRHVANSNRGQLPHVFFKVGHAFALLGVRGLLGSFLEEAKRLLFLSCQYLGQAVVPACAALLGPLRVCVRCIINSGRRGFMHMESQQGTGNTGSPYVIHSPWTSSPNYWFRKEELS